MDKIDELIELVDIQLGIVTPGTEQWGNLLRHRKALLKQKGELIRQEKDKKPEKSRVNPDVVIQCVTGVVQVVGVAVVGFLTRIDREALRFIRKP